VAEKQESADPNGRLERFKCYKCFNVINAAEQTRGHKTRKEVRKPCVTDKMIDMMEERKKWKSIRSEEGRKNINH